MSDERDTNDETDETTETDMPRPPQDTLNTDTDDRLYTRREWMMRSAILNGDTRGGVPALMLVRESVSSVAIEHPEWDMDGEKKTWAEWVADEIGPEGDE